MKWQPIETAPRDKTTILVWCDGDCYAVWWVPRYDADGEFWNDFEGWGVSDNNNEPHPLCGRPTHWMSLPAPPTT